MFDSRMAILQDLKASPGQTVSSFVTRPSRTALRHAFVSWRGIAASQVRGCLGQEEILLASNVKTLSFLRYRGAGQC